MAWKFSGFDGGCVPLAEVLLSGCCGDVAGLLESRLDDGAVADEASWRRAVLALELSQPRIDGEQKEGAGDGAHRLRQLLDAKAESVCLHFGHLMPYFEVFATHKTLCSFSLRQFVYCVICACERAPCTRWPL